MKKEIFHFIVQLEEVAEIKNPGTWDVRAGRRLSGARDAAVLLALTLMPV